MADVSHDSVLEAFKVRYDHQSATTVLNNALQTSGLGAKDKYSDGDVKKLDAALGALGETQTAPIFETLAGPPPAAPAAKADKKDDKKDAKKDDKKDDKKDAKKAKKK